MILLVTGPLGGEAPFPATVLLVAVVLLVVRSLVTVVLPSVDVVFVAVVVVALLGARIRVVVEL